MIMECSSIKVHLWPSLGRHTDTVFPIRSTGFPGGVEKPGDSGHPRCLSNKEPGNFMLGEHSVSAFLIKKDPRSRSRMPNTEVLTERVTHPSPTVHPLLSSGFHSNWARGSKSTEKFIKLTLILHSVSLPLLTSTKSPHSPGRFRLVYQPEILLQPFLPQNNTSTAQPRSHTPP